MERTNRLLRCADLAVSMNLETIRGELGAFDGRLHRLACPYPGQIDCAENVRRLTEGSDMTSDKGRFAFGYDKAPRAQDAICVRATPQTHGGVRDVFSFARKQIEADITEGELSMARTELALSALLTALADISERRAFRLNDTHLSYGLPRGWTLSPPPCPSSPLGVGQKPHTAACASGWPCSRRTGSWLRT
ncbi:MAG: aromatic amino acid ammonia-lyase [Oscillospiraceae bacterium]|nr:aromatic amino acid ammonia-lyase [Oscillospiraceae bacterium]